MKVNAVRNIKNCSHFKGIENKSDKKVEKNLKNAKLLGLVALSSAALACIAINHASKNNPKLITDLKTSYKNTTKKIIKKVQPQRRDAQAVRRYQYAENQRKMESLHQRLFNGEFKDKSPEAMEKIRRNEINFAKATGRLK